jgi:hypothetical protein
VTNESERVRWAITPRYVQFMDTAADGWPPLLGVVVLVLVMGGILASGVLAWQEIVRDGVRSLAVLACVGVVFLASLWGLIDRVVVMPRMWRRQRGGDAIDSAWRQWRAEAMGWLPRSCGRQVGPGRCALPNQSLSVSAFARPCPTQHERQAG